MNLSSSEILSLTNEAAVLVQHGRVSFSNAAARRLLGEGCVGQTVQSLFGPEVAGMQASSFLADISLGERSFLVRVTRTGEGQILFISPEETAPVILNDAFLWQLRSELMNVGIAADALRAQAERSGNAETLAVLCSLNRSYCTLMRLSANASLLYSWAKGTSPILFQTVDLAALCREAFSVLGDAFPDIDFRFSGPEMAELAADPSYVLLQLTNLLSNSILHARGLSRVSVNLTDTGSSYILSVSDDGCGIPPEALPTVFDRYRHSFSPLSAKGGAGLGLSAARIVSQIHKGALLLESRPGQGTAVRVSYSKQLKPSAALSGEAARPDAVLRALMTGLSSCLPERYYTEKYQD